MMKYKNRFLKVCVVASLTLFAHDALSNSDAGNPKWSPQSSERLVKLPTGYLEKSIKHDFAGSELARAISELNEDIGLKAQTLKDLQGAIQSADGEVQLELRHQFLAQKRDLLDMMSKRGSFERRHLKTRIKLYGRILDELRAEAGGNAPARQTLIDRQEAAQQRFSSSLDKVDMKIFQYGAAKESRYSRKYAENLQAIEKLVSRIESHKQGASADEAVGDISKEEYVRRMLTDAESEVALVDQEEKIVGYMAKLVSLDALDLAEKSLDAEMSDSDVPASTGAAVVVDLFTQ